MEVPKALPSFQDRPSSATSKSISKPKSKINEPGLLPQESLSNKTPYRKKKNPFSTPTQKQKKKKKSLKRKKHLIKKKKKKNSAPHAASPPPPHRLANLLCEFLRLLHALQPQPQQRVLLPAHLRGFFGWGNSGGREAFKGSVGVLEGGNNIFKKDQLLEFLGRWLES